MKNKRKSITTTLNEEMLKEMKKSAIDNGCNVNDIIECCYQYSMDMSSLNDILESYKDG